MASKRTPSPKAFSKLSEVEATELLIEELRTFLTTDQPSTVYLQGVAQLAKLVEHLAKVRPVEVQQDDPIEAIRLSVFGAA